MFSKLCFYSVSWGPWLSICCCSVAKLCLSIYDPMDYRHQASMSFSISGSLFKLMSQLKWLSSSSSMSAEQVIPSNHLVLCHLLLLLPSVLASIRVFSNQSALCISWPKYGRFTFSISPSSGCSVLIFFKINCFDFLAAQGILKSFLQHHSLKASILWLSAFFVVQLSHPYMTTGKTIALTTRIFAGKEISLPFNMLSRFVIAFLQRSQYLLSSWLQSPPMVILEPKKIKSVTVSIFPYLFAMKWWDQMPWSSFCECWVLSKFFHAPLSPSSRGSLVPLHFLPWGWCSSAYLKLLIFLPVILAPVCASSSPAFTWHTLYTS